jgi:hypothetical protein
MTRIKLILLTAAAVLLFSISCSVAGLMEEAILEDEAYEEDTYHGESVLEDEEDYEDESCDDPSSEPAAEKGDVPTAEVPAVSPGFCANGDCGGSCLYDLSPIEDPGANLSNDQRSYQSIYGEDGLLLIAYTVDEDAISDPYYSSDSPEWLDIYADNTFFHQELWRFFTTLIPADTRSDILGFQLMTDGEEETLASVFPSEEDPYVWVLEVDVMDTGNAAELSSTLIHEAGHLISLNASQVPPSMAIFQNPWDDDVYYAEMDACATYFPGEGCANPDSYIYLFYQEFWVDIYDEWLDIDWIEDEDEYYEALDNFYWRYEDEFVTDYAVTNTEEDFAETFAAFVINPEPQGNTIAEKKILFFYDFPELVEMRIRIALGLCSMAESR